MPQPHLPCPGCGGAPREPLFEARQTPVLLCELWPDEASARACPRGDILLVSCPNCGLIENEAFDPGLVHYSDAYENSLGGSPKFIAYQEALAQDVIERHGLRDRQVVEIGCGNGAFLERLCELGDNRGLGFDPSYPEELPLSRLGGRVLFVRELFEPGQQDVPIDVLISRQVLEHIPDPARFLVEVLGNGLGSAASLVLEVPNTEYTLRNLALWEVTYEHCTYFTRGSLARLLARCGFDVTHAAQTYSDQFITVDARPASQGEGTGSVNADVEDPAELARLICSFAEGYAARIETWRNEVKAWAERGATVALWGSGTRGVSFLNIADPGATIRYVLDVNPRKHGKHVPGTGQRILSPDELGEASASRVQPDVVLVVNPIYEQEITRDLNSRGLSPEIRTL